MMVSALTRPVELSRHPAVARRELTELLRDAAWDGDVDAVLLAVHEAMVNAQRHGGGVTHAGAGFDGRSLVVEITDRGRGFHVPDSPGVPEVTAERGRGLFLIRRLTSDAHLVRDGADVRLVLTFDR
ncbi:MAG TPA: ATP-binding protein [Acidimicrobiales bacterium]|nr:ATP-binding protein [Acidimicrobiales bacterium]